jgi:hypothetical protein
VLDKHADQQLIDRPLTAFDLLIAIGFPCAQFQAIERALARQASLAGGALAAHHRQQRVVAQLVVIAQVLIAQCEAIDSLRHQLSDAVLD